MSLYRRSAESITDGNGISSIGVCHFVLCEAPPLFKGRWLPEGQTEGSLFDTAPGQLRKAKHLRRPPLFKGRWLPVGQTEGSL